MIKLFVSIDISSLTKSAHVNPWIIITNRRIIEISQIILFKGFRNYTVKCLDMMFLAKTTNITSKITNVPLCKNQSLFIFSS